MLLKKLLKRVYISKHHLMFEKESGSHKIFLILQKINILRLKNYQKTKIKCKDVILLDNCKNIKLIKDYTI